MLGCSCCGAKTLLSIVLFDSSFVHSPKSTFRVVIDVPRGFCTQSMFVIELSCMYRCADNRNLYAEHGKSRQDLHSSIVDCKRDVVGSSLCLC